MAKAFPIGRTRYQIGDTPAHDSYFGAVDQFDDQKYLARRIQITPSRQDLLWRLRQTRHPFLPRLHDLIPQEGSEYLLIFGTRAETMQSLSEAKISHMRVSQLQNLLLAMINAFWFLNHLELRLPKLRLSSILVDHLLRPCILGIEEAQSLDQDLQPDQVDMTYDPPEYFARRKHRPTSEIYRLAAMIYHLLTGTVHNQNRTYVSVSEHNHRIKGAWDDLLRRMLEPDASRRPDWSDVYATAFQINRGAPLPEPAFSPIQDTATLARLNQCLEESEGEPQVMALQTHTGEDIFQRLTPFQKICREQGYLTLRLRMEQDVNRAYKVINHIIAQLRQDVLPFLNRPDLAAQFTPFSEWYSLDELAERWRELIEAFLAALIPEFATGVVLILENFQNIDERSLEALCQITPALAGKPVFILLTFDTLTDPRTAKMQETWPFFWGRHCPKSLSPTHYDRLVWPHAMDPEQRASIFKLSSGHQAFCLQQLTSFGDYEDKPEAFLTRIWTNLHLQERMILKILAFSFRPLTSADIRFAFELDNPEQHLNRLSFSGYIVGDDDAGYTILAKYLLHHGQTRTQEQDRDHIRRKLLDYEQTRPRPDELQMAALAYDLEPIKGTRLVNQLINVAFEDLHLPTIQRVEHLPKLGPPFDAIVTLGALLRAKTISANDQRKLPMNVRNLASAIRAKNKGKLERAQDLLRELMQQESLSAPLRALVCLHLADCAMQGRRPVVFGKTWRLFMSVDPMVIQEDLHHEWVARMISIAIKLDRFERPMKAMADALPKHLKLLIDAQAAERDGHYEDMLTRTQQAVVLFADHYDLSLRGRIYKDHGNALYRNNQGERAIKAYQQAQECYRAIENHHGATLVELNLAAAHLLNGDIRIAEPRLNELADHPMFKADEEGSRTIHYHLMVTAMLLNDRQNFERHFEMFHRLAKLAQDHADQAKAYIVKLHDAIGRSKDEITHLIAKLKSRCAQFQADASMQAEVMASIRLGRLAMNQFEPAHDDQPLDHTQWRHHFVDAIQGGRTDYLPTLIDQRGSGFFAALHTHLLKAAVEQHLIPSAYFNRKLMHLFEDYALSSGARYVEFLRRHFALVRRTVEGPDAPWRHAASLFDHITWPLIKPSVIQKEVLRRMNEIWHFQLWGAVVGEGSNWTAIIGETRPDLHAHLNQFTDDELFDPIVTLIYDQHQSTRQLLILPLGKTQEGPSKATTLAWFLGDPWEQQQAEARILPILNFYGRFLQLALSDRTRHKEEPHPQKTHTQTFGIVGQSEPIQQILHKIQQFGPTELNMFITGESGSGKELAAYAVHQASQRANKPFRAINCSHYPDQLVEAELFGHKRGAYTGAADDRAGLLEMVNGGTLFLDEIGDINPKVQSLLLRVVQEGEFSRIGDNRIRKVDIRFITATNKDLKTMIDQGDFRGDLYFRIVEEEITMPPLRARYDDLPLLARFFAEKYDTERRPVFTNAFFDHMRSYHWPGNVREYENYIRKLLIQHPKVRNFEPDHCPPFLRQGAPKPLEEENLTLHAFDEINRARFIGNRLQRFEGNRTHAAKSLGISRQQLSNLIGKYHIDQ